MTVNGMGPTQDARNVRGGGRRGRLVAAAVSLLLVAGCGSRGDDERLDSLDRQAASADEALQAVGETFQSDFDGTTTGPGRARFGTCGLSPSDRVSYRARVTWRSLAGSDEDTAAAATQVLEDLGWTVESAASSGLRAERGGASARLSIGPAATEFSVQSECVGVPDPDSVTERPEKTFGLG